MAPFDIQVLLRHRPWVQALARRLLHGDEHRAEDAVQETWAAALRTPPRTDSLPGWLRTTVRNVALRFRRDDHRRRGREERVARTESVSDVDLAERAERHRALVGHVLALREPYRATVLLRYFEGLDAAAIAERQGVPPGTVRVRLKRALDMLRGRLERDHGLTWLVPLAALTVGGTMKLKFAVLAVLLVAAALAVSWYLVAGRDGDSRSRRAERTGASRTDGDVADAACGSNSPVSDGDTVSEPATTGSEPGGAVAPSEAAAGKTPFRVRGRVRGLGDRPSGVTIVVSHIRIAPRRLFDVAVDEAGAFTAALPESGAYLVEAGHKKTFVRVRFEVGDADPEHEVVVSFPAGGVVAGQVYNTYGALDDDVHGAYRPMGQEDLEVRVVPVTKREDAEALPFSRVDERGAYRLAGLAPGEYDLVLPARFHIERIVVPEGRELRHDVRLPAGRIEGSVRDAESDDPVDTVQVVVGLVTAEDGREARLRAAGYARLSARCTPDPEGRYRFANLPPGEYNLFANGGYYGLHTARGTLAAPELRAVVDFSVQRGAAVDLAVVDPDGQSLPGLRVWSQGISWGFAGRASGLKAGTFPFAAWAPGHEFQVREAVEFPPGATVPLRFELKPAVELELRFLDPAGKPVPGVRVAARRGSWDLMRLLGSPVTDARGVVHLRGFAAGPCRIVAKKSGYAALDSVLTLHAGENSRSLRLKEAATSFSWRLRVTRVAPGSAAAAAGMQKGSVLLRYGGADIQSLDQLRAALAAAKSSGAADVALEFEADGRRRETRVRTGVLGVSLEEFEAAR